MCADNTASGEGLAAIGNAPEFGWYRPQGHWLSKTLLSLKSNGELARMLTATSTVTRALGEDDDGDEDDDDDDDDDGSKEGLWGS